jgi:hypothetical protein
MAETSVSGGIRERYRFYEIFLDVVRGGVSFDSPCDTPDILILETLHRFQDPVFVRDTIRVRECDNFAFASFKSGIPGCIRTLNPVLHHGYNRKFLYDSSRSVFGVIIDNDNFEFRGGIVQRKQGLDAIPDVALAIVYRDDTRRMRRSYLRNNPFLELSILHGAPQVP